MTRRHAGHRAVADQLHRELTVRRSWNPVVIGWRWRWETTLVLAAVGFGSVVPLAVGLSAGTVLVLALLVVPSLRRRAADRFWCIATQHMLRTGLHEADVRSWSGRAPAILWTSARSRNQRILLLCPPGVDVHRVSAAREELAAACWAQDVHVERHPRYAHLVVVFVVRGAPSGSGPR